MKIAFNEFVNIDVNCDNLLNEISDFFPSYMLSLVVIPRDTNLMLETSRFSKKFVSFLIKLQASVCSFFKNETLAQVFSCKFSESSKNTFSYRTPTVAASVSLFTQDQTYFYFEFLRFFSSVLTEMSH